MICHNLSNSVLLRNLYTQTNSYCLPIRKFFPRLLYPSPNILWLVTGYRYIYIYIYVCIFLDFLSSVLLSAHIDWLSVSRIRDFFTHTLKKNEMNSTKQTTMFFNVCLSAVPPKNLLTVWTGYFWLKRIFLNLQN